MHGISKYLTFQTKTDMTKQQLFEQIRKKQSFLCVGLDTDIKKIPEHLLESDDQFTSSTKPLSMQLHLLRGI